MRCFRIVLLFISFIFVNNSISLAKDSIRSMADSSIVISPIPGNNPHPPIPRSPSIVPISASYEASTASVILYFSHNLGEIEIEVLNTITGYYNYSVVDTLNMSAIISLNGGSGHYVIIFTLPSGQQYIGELDS